MSIEIFVDIETLPTPRADIRARVSKDVSPPANYKNAEAIDKWWVEQGKRQIEEAVNKTALDGTWGEILCIGFAVEDGPIEVLTRGMTEADLINSFALLVSSQCKTVTRHGDMWDQVAKWIGHNVQDFDIRFIWQRAVINGVKLPFSLPIGKPSYGRGPSVYDTMREWSGWKGYVKQTDLELAFGLSRTDPLANGGADVFAAYTEGRLEDVKAHCAEDVRLLRELYRRMANG